MRKYILYIVCLALSIAGVHSQTAIPSTKELKTPYNFTDGSLVLAYDLIKLSPGFSYKADAGKAVTMRVATSDDLAPRTIKLYYTEDTGKTFKGEYQGVRVGEYYWTDNNLNHYTDAGESSITVAQIDSSHARWAMFDYFRPPADPTRRDPTYWSYGVTLNQFHKYYGTYYKLPDLFYQTKNAMMGEGTQNNLVDWRLPQTKDVLQLVGMCGHGTKPEVIQYLSFSVRDNKAPSFAKISAPWGVDKNGVNQGKYYWWFNQTQALEFDPWNKKYSDFKTDTYSLLNENKYSFNLVGAGTRWHSVVDGYMSSIVQTYALPNNGVYKRTYNYYPKHGELKALNQVLYFPMAGYSFLHIGEGIFVSYTVYVERMPARLCRPLTNEELGYKLYINQDVKSVMIRDYVSGNGHDYGGVVADESGKRYLPREFSGEELLLRKVFVDKKVQSANVNIVKRGLSEPIPAGYMELPRGYIRGLYVQYILDNPSPTKTIADLLRIAWNNQGMWLGSNASLIPKTTLLKSTSTIPLRLDDEAISIRPNPVVDILYLNQTADKVEIYNTTGSLVKTIKSVSQVDVNNLSAGLYIVKITANGKTTSHKVMKK